MLRKLRHQTRQKVIRNYHFVLWLSMVHLCSHFSKLAEHCQHMEMLYLIIELDMLKVLSNRISLMSI